MWKVRIMTTIYLAILFNIFQMGYKQTILKALFKSGLRETVVISSTVSLQKTATTFRVTASILSVPLTHSSNYQETMKRANFSII
jgi:CRISPR/Cas system CSM-associated protein Csm4 (group 5 of RAMP superfamily)